MKETDEEDEDEEEYSEIDADEQAFLDQAKVSSNGDEEGEEYDEDFLQEQHPAVEKSCEEKNSKRKQ